MGNKNMFFFFLYKFLCFSQILYQIYVKKLLWEKEINCTMQLHQNMMVLTILWECVKKNIIKKKEKKRKREITIVTFGGIKKH